MVLRLSDRSEDPGNVAMKAEARENNAVSFCDCASCVEMQIFLRAPLEMQIFVPTLFHVFGMERAENW